MEIDPILHAPAILARLENELAAPRGIYLPLRIENDVVGWVDEARAEVLARFDDVFDWRTIGSFTHPCAQHLSRPSLRAPRRSIASSMSSPTKAVSAHGGESGMRLRRTWGRRRLCLIERAAARCLRHRTYAAHVNGLVRGEPTSMWLARRSPGKAIDPGMLDNLVGEA